MSIGLNFFLILFLSILCGPMVRAASSLCAQQMTVSSIVNRTGLDGNLVKQGVNALRERGPISLHLMDGPTYGAALQREGLRELRIKVELTPGDLAEHQKNHRPPHQMTLHFSTRGSDWSQAIVLVYRPADRTAGVYVGEVQYFGLTTQILLQAESTEWSDLPGHFMLLLSGEGSSANQ